MVSDLFTSEMSRLFKPNPPNHCEHSPFSAKFSVRERNNLIQIHGVAVRELYGLCRTTARICHQDREALQTIFDGGGDQKHVGYAMIHMLGYDIVRSYRGRT